MVLCDGVVPARRGNTDRSGGATTAATIGGTFMRSPPRVVPLAVLGIALLAANPRSEPLEFVYRGNEAFVGGDFTAAVDLYTAAEDTISDPGLVAFNKGAAFYH